MRMILLGLVGVEIVENDVDLPLGMLGHDQFDDEAVRRGLCAQKLGAGLVGIVQRSRSLN